MSATCSRPHVQQTTATVALCVGVGVGEFQHALLVHVSEQPCVHTECASLCFFYCSMWSSISPVYLLFCSHISVFLTVFWVLSWWVLWKRSGERVLLHLSSGFKCCRDQTEMKWVSFSVPPSVCSDQVNYTCRSHTAITPLHQVTSGHVTLSCCLLYVAILVALQKQGMKISKYV